MSLFMYSPQPRKKCAPLTFLWEVQCPECHGRGWYTTDGYSEVYCFLKCEAAKWRRIYDGCNDD